MEMLEGLGQKIDNAIDSKDEQALRELGQICRDRLETEEGGLRVALRYLESNTYAGIVDARSSDDAYRWSWDQSDAIAQILALRQAVKEPAFEDLDPTLACRIRTNLGNCLLSLGRPIAAIEQWDAVLQLNPKFAMAVGNRASGILEYGRSLYDHTHTSIMHVAARSGYNATFSDDADWQSDELEFAAPIFSKARNEIAAYLEAVEYDEDFNLNQWSLGESDEERRYRQWCLDKRLFLNPLNDAMCQSVAATDVLHLPSHVYKFGETPRFPDYYNLMKQEYISARYRLYRARYEEENTFLTRDVLMLDTGESVAFGHYTEDLKSAFRSAYAIFDKVGLFLNDYYLVRLDPGAVSFRKVWSEKPKGASEFRLRPIFDSNQNWLLRGLYFLSKDLFDEAFNDVAEPDAAELSGLRNRAEHRFLSLRHFDFGGPSTETHSFISVSSFEEKALRMLKMAREALVYLSLAMHREEAMRLDRDNEDGKVTVPILSQPIESFERF